MLGGPSVTPRLGAGRVRLGCDAAAQIREKLRAAFEALAEEIAARDLDARPAELRHALSLFEDHHSIYVRARAHGAVVVVQDAEAREVHASRLSTNDLHEWIEQLSIRPSKRSRPR